MRRRARRASARRGAAGRRPTVCGRLPLIRSGLWWCWVCQLRITPVASRYCVRSGPAAGRLARRRCALEDVKKVVTGILMGSGSGRSGLTLVVTGFVP
jgi:hypothetical protein